MIVDAVQTNAEMHQKLPSFKLFRWPVRSQKDQCGVDVSAYRLGCAIYPLNERMKQCRRRWGKEQEPSVEIENQE